MKKQNGITLIALIITIIVILILAGVSISMLSGDTSILKRAQDATVTMQQAEQTEEQRLQNLTDFFVNYTSDDTTGDGENEGIVTPTEYVWEKYSVQEIVTDYSLEELVGSNLGGNTNMWTGVDNIFNHSYLTQVASGCSTDAYIHYGNIGYYFGIDLYDSAGTFSFEDGTLNWTGEPTTLGTFYDSALWWTNKYTDILETDGGYYITGKVVHWIGGNYEHMNNDQLILWPYYFKPTTANAKGEEFIEEVTSSDSTSFPTDGYYDGYWYVYKGIK